MNRSVSLFLSRAAPEAGGSVAYVNSSIAPVLAADGWEPRLFAPPPPNQFEEALLPFGFAAAQLRMQAQTARFALFDDTGAMMVAPSRAWAEHNLVVYHGLAYGQGSWMANPAIDLHCANSAYLARVLRALFAFPDWSQRRCLDARALGAVTALTLPLPPLAHPAGHPAFRAGQALPVQVHQLVARGETLAHAMQPRKQDWPATIAILHGLNMRAAAEGAPRVRLAVPQASLDPQQQKLLERLLAPVRRRWQEYLIPLPQLSQRALFELMRMSRFGLAYNCFPEPFGFYMLESVLHGCPVYTSGIGNNRFLLPPDHGTRVADLSPDAAGNLPYEKVVDAIHARLCRPEATADECRRGAAVIAGRWNLDTFASSLGQALEMAEARQGATPPDFEELVVALSPTVRSLDPATGACLNDYGNVVLSSQALAGMQALIGKSCADLDSHDMAQFEAQHGLFRRAILTLVAPDPP